MTKDGIGGIACTILFGVIVALVGRDWVMSAFSSDPAAAMCFTLCALALGYLACSLVHVGRRSGIVKLTDEIERLRTDYANERAYTAALLAKLPPEERMTSGEVVATIENAKDYDDEVDAAKLGATPEQVRSLGATARRILHEMDDEDTEAFVELCARCMGGEMLTGERGIPIPMMVDVDEGFPLNPDSIRRLRALGLIDFAIGTGLKTNSLYDCIDGEFVQINKTTYAIKGNGQTNLAITQRPFTEFGRELASLCALGVADGFERTLIDNWKRQGFKVSALIKRNPDGTYLCKRV